MKIHQQKKFTASAHFKTGHTEVDPDILASIREFCHRDLARFSLVIKDGDHETAELRGIMP